MIDTAAAVTRASRMFSDHDLEGFQITALEASKPLSTEQVAEKQHGFIGIEHAPSISWRTLASRPQ
jgi:hypothetical protein